MNLLTKMLKKKNYSPSYVCEIGVWHPKTSNIKYYIEKDIKTLLIEPDPESIALIKKEWGNRKNFGDLIEKVVIDRMSCFHRFSSA